MSKLPLKMEHLKYALGALIVAAAVIIMFPGFLNLATGLGRMFLLIAIPLIVCGGIAVTVRRMSKSKKEIGTADNTRSS